MEAAIQTVVKVFLKSTKGKESLGKKEFQSLVSSQLSNILTDTDSKEAINNMGQELDANHDGKVGFEEYMKLVGYLACSLSDQRNLAKEEPAQNAASGQVAQSAPDKEEEKPEANAEAKEEAKPKANEEAKADGTAEANIKAKADPEVEVKVDTKAEGETKPEVAKEEPEAAVAAAAVAAAAAVGAETGDAPAAQAAEKEAEETEETVKVEEAAEKLPAAAEEEGEKKTEEASS